MLQLYDTLAGEKRPFQAIVPQQVGIYACGMTVYDACHIGHARGMVAFDGLVRLMQSLGFKVNYVRNITDIDDKIIKRAQEKGITARELADTCIADMQADCQALGLIPPQHEPRATDYIADMIRLIDELMQRDLAYVATNGDVCFAVHAFPEYGKLSHRSLDQLLSGVLIAAEQAKQNPLDFVLWKPAKPGEPSWESPWGAGRPGWHIECSAMSSALLGQPFDIHGGGMDLKFPHHENEIAQSEGACGLGYANYWMHIGLVQVDGEKMSKSLGNFTLIKQMLAQYPAEVIRYWMLASHYRSPVNYSEANLQQATQALRRLYTALHGLSWEALPMEQLHAVSQTEVKAFIAAMLDDMNTPEALASLFKLAGALNRAKEQQDMTVAIQLAQYLAAAGEMLGILLLPPHDFLRGDTAALDVVAIEELIAAREQARAAKDWPTADKIRDQLLQQGIELDDTSEGTTWKKL